MPSAPFDAFESIPEPVEPEQSWEDSLMAGGRTSLALSTMTIKPRQAIYDSWCYAGDLGFIFAARGLGKTWLAIHLARGAATGTNVGPWKNHRQEKVVYLDGEMPPQDIQFRDRILGQPTPNLLYVNHQILFEVTGKIMNLANVDCQNGILDFCHHNNFTMLFLDNLSTLASGMDENKSIDWEVINPWLLRIRRCGITVVFIHHAGRNDQMRGNSKREDNSAWIMHLKSPPDSEQQDGAHFIAEFTKWRSSSKKPKTYEWIYDPRENGEVLVEVKEAAALDIFRCHVESGLDTCKLIADEMSISSGYASKLATQGSDQGWLEIKERKYRIKRGFNAQKSD